MGKITMLMGPSSTGKDTLLNYILVKDSIKKFGLQEIVLHTTRPPRTGEVK